MPPPVVRALLFTENAVPYRAALYRHTAEQPEINLTVVVLDSSGLTKQLDPEMKVAYSWDCPMFEGLDLIVASPHFDESDGKIHGVPGYELSRNPFRWLAKYRRVFCRSFTPQALRIPFQVPHDVVLLENYGTLACLLLAMLSRLRGKRIILRSEAYHHPYRKRSIVAIKAVYLRFFYALCHTVIYCCEKSRTYFESTGCPARKLSFLPAAVDGPFFRKQQEKLVASRDTLRCAIGVTDSNWTVFITVGRLSRRKRNRELIQAFARAHLRNATLVIVGDGPERESLEEMVHAEGIKNIIFSGFRNQTEVCEYYISADVYAQFSDYDPSPKSVSEALEFGLPVLLSDNIGNAPELCRGNGMLTNPEDMAAASKAIRQMGTDPQRLKAMSTRSRELATEYSITANGKRVAEIIRAASPTPRHPKQEETNVKPTGVEEKTCAHIRRP